MDIVILTILGYLMSGYGNVMHALHDKSKDKPAWTLNPTWQKKLFNLLLWPIEVWKIAQVKGIRKVAYGICHIIIEIVVAAFFVRICFYLSGLIFDDLLTQTVLAFFLCWLPALMVVPIAYFLMAPTAAMIEIICALCFLGNE